MIRGAIHHNVKSHPEPFLDVRGGRKRHEVRRDDRDYQPGDTITFHEFSTYFTHGESSYPPGYTGEYCGPFLIGSVTRGGWGLPDGVCVFTLLDFKPPEKIWGDECPSRFCAGILIAKDGVLECTGSGKHRYTLFSGNDQTHPEWRKIAGGFPPHLKDATCMIHKCEPCEPQLKTLNVREEDGQQD